MTTHVFIVNEKSFKAHLEYLFVGTGSKDTDIDFNGLKHSQLHHQTENGLTAMMADFSRVRKDDFVIFYVQATKNKEGKFYGIYQINSEPFHEPNGTYLKLETGKPLTFRALIKPFKVFAKGVSEWEALDEIKGIHSPNQMLWSLIYRKLKGNRGNTMITIYEANRLFHLIESKNNYTSIDSTNFSYNNVEQVKKQQSSVIYNGNTNRAFDILPRLIQKKLTKKAYEAHLQMYITQQLGRNASLDSALKINKDKLEWIGNEVSCGVGMQRIDIMLSQNKDSITKEIIPIELKAVPASEDNIRQISRYIDWIEQYYIPNMPSIIRPVLICPKSELSQKTIDAFNAFNSNSKGRYLPLEYIEVTDNGNDLIFTNTTY
ncbi:MAG: EVE domain-containing protein [Bacteroidales bacterium]|nr:EVE domain-containing protein [Bacteroidales bacterium]